MSDCTDELRRECGRRFDRLEELLVTALEARVHVGRIEGAARLFGWLVMAAVAGGALYQTLLK